MKYIHNLKVTVFSKPEDNEEDICKILLSLFPFNMEQQKIRLQRTMAEGFEHRRIVVYEVSLHKDRHINEFLQNLLANLSSEQKKLLLQQLESRVDKEGNFFIRLDKDKLIRENEWSIANTGNCFHIRMSMAAFPATREKAIEVVRGMLH